MPATQTAQGTPVQDATIARLAAYVSQGTFDSLPAQAVHECRRRLIDSVACAAAAFREPSSAQMREFASGYQGEPGARIWGTGARTSVEMAAFTNGAAIRYLDYNDTFFGQAAGHPSDIIGALVAVAEAQGRDGRALLTAIVLSYEVFCGLCDSVPLGKRGLDHATSAAVGAAAGAAKLLGLDEARIGQALAMALAPNLHLFNVRRGALSEWKGLAGPNGARNGVFAALLARAGLTGPTGVVDGEGGLCDVLGKFEWKVGARALPLITATHIKFHPACYHGQSAMDAAMALRGRVAIDDIERIDVATHDASFQTMAGDPQRWAPENRETADHSLPYTVCVALRDGVIRADSFADAQIREPRIRALMARVHVTNSPEMTALFPGQSQARVTITTRDGRTLEHLQNHPRGHALNPLSDAELEEKFIAAYASWGDAQAARRTLAALWKADGATRVSTLVDLFVAAD